MKCLDKKMRILNGKLMKSNDGKLIMGGTDNAIYMHICIFFLMFVHHHFFEGIYVQYKFPHLVDFR